MSNKAITWARDIPVRGNTKLVLFILADHADKDDNTCWPGVNRLAQIGGISSRDVIRQIKELTKLGWMSKEMRPNTSNMYRLNLELKPESIAKNGHTARGDTMSGVTSCQGGGDDMSGLGVTPCQGNPNRTLIEPICKVSTSSIKNIFEHWQKTFHHPKAKLDKPRQAITKKALGLGFSEDELKKAIEGCAITPWNMGENENGTKYHAINLIFRNAEYIERYIDNYKNPPNSKRTSVANDPLRGAI